MSELLGIAQFSFHDGKVEEFKRLSAQCMVLERYRDSEALMEHAAHIGDLMEAIVVAGSVSGELLGEPNAELRANLTGSPVRLFRLYQSM